MDFLLLKNLRQTAPDNSNRECASYNPNNHECHTGSSFLSLLISSAPCGKLYLKHFCTHFFPPFLTHSATKTSTIKRNPHLKLDPKACFTKKLCSHVFKNAALCAESSLSQPFMHHKPSHSQRASSANWQQWVAGDDAHAGDDAENSVIELLMTGNDRNHDELTSASASRAVTQCSTVIEALLSGISAYTTGLLRRRCRTIKQGSLAAVITLKKLFSSWY